MSAASAVEPLDTALVRAGGEVNRALFDCGVREYEAALLVGGDGGDAAADRYRASLERLRDAYARLSSLEALGARARVDAVEAGRAELQERVGEASRGGRYGERRVAHMAMRRLAPRADCVIEVEAEADAPAASGASAASETSAAKAGPRSPGSGPAPPDPDAAKRRAERERERSRVKTALRKRRVRGKLQAP